MRHLLAAVTAALLFASPAAAQSMACQASLPVPPSGPRVQAGTDTRPPAGPPANVDILTRTSGTLILQRLGADALGSDVLWVVVIHSARNVFILIMKDGLACRFPVVPVTDYEKALRAARGVSA